jgi:acetyl/propionyl-CoA carboxylase alpha subunit
MKMEHILAAPLTAWSRGVAKAGAQVQVDAVLARLKKKDEK